MLSFCLEYLTFTKFYERGIEMARKNYRALTVTEAAGSRKAGTPGIRIQGQWLQELGFKVRDPVLVQCEDGKIVIQKDNLRIKRREQEQEELKKLQERYETEKKRIKDHFVAERSA